MAGEHEKASQAIRKSEEKLKNTISQTDREARAERAGHRQELEENRFDFGLRNEMQNRDLNRELNRKVAALKQDINLTKETSAREHRLTQESFSDSIQDSQAANRSNLRTQDSENKLQLADVKEDSQKKLLNYISKDEFRNRNRLEALEAEALEDWKISIDWFSIKEKKITIINWL